MTGFMLDQANEHHLKSGKWVGYFVDPRGLEGPQQQGNQWPIDIYLIFSQRGRKFHAVGIDEVDEFFLEGNITGSKVTFIKRYRSHKIYYGGHIFGEQISGSWWFPGSHPIGTFVMWKQLD